MIINKRQKYLFVILKARQVLDQPRTFLTCKKTRVVNGTRYVTVTAAVSTARPDLKRIQTVKDNDKDNDCLDRFLDGMHV